METNKTEKSENEQFIEIIKLSDDMLAKMFFELRIDRTHEKRLMFIILKELLSRNKLNILFSSKK